MDENIVNPEATTPTDERGATAPAEEVTEVESATNEGEPEATTPMESPSEEPAEAEPSFGLEITYNKAKRTLNKDEATDYAQKGVHYQEKVMPLYNKLDYVAAQRGQSIEEVVDGLLSSDEENHRRGLIERFGEEDNDVIEDLMRVYRDGQKQRYERIVADRKKAAEEAATKERESLEARLADEFSELKKEFPEIKEFAELPKSVKAEAANGRDLLSSFLRYRHAEEKKTAEAKAAEEAAAKATTGTGQDNLPVTDSVDHAMLSGIFKR